MRTPGASLKCRLPLRDIKEIVKTLAQIVNSLPASDLKTKLVPIISDLSDGVGLKESFSVFVKGS